ncbi:hypothetical protein L1987_50834 [Smallanthus sonchifolius]|uniref:Uncharacterized protein n=1 Tax=Smallanthus sonchifolius TaxID=185202 RepID=A0ACB9ENB4_9ASTR|nr:hypothetical protein L1987_50834 [Smallanthus sonchifolius]
MCSSDAPIRVRRSSPSFLLISSNLHRILVLMSKLISRFHCAATFDVKTATGGPFGTMRHKAEQNHGANVGLDVAVEMLEPIKQQFPLVSYGDLYGNFDYKMAGIVALESTGGPEITFHTGRPDMDAPPEEGRLPLPNFGHEQLRNTFVNTMGLTDQDIVALSGGHTLIC